MEILFGMILLFVLYFLPTIIGGYRRIRRQSQLIIINLFLGWTFIGWVVCLAWAFTPDVMGGENCR